MYKRKKDCARFCKCGARGVPTLYRETGQTRYNNRTRSFAKEYISAAYAWKGVQPNVVFGARPVRAIDV